MDEVVARGTVIICGRCWPARYILGVLGAIGMAITYALKVNLSIAMVAMINHTAIAALNEKPNETTTEHSSQNKDGPFDWSPTLQGIILSAYFWGYLVFQIPGGRVAEVCSAKWMMFAAIVLNIVATVLTPISSTLHFSILIIMRVLEGVGGAVTFPCMHILLAHWAPPNERSVLSSLVYAGTCLGTVGSILIAGVIGGSLGWEAVFYIMAALAAPWCLFWVWLVQDYPRQQRFMSQEERDYIQNSLDQGSTAKKASKVPWKAVFSSAPFWAILVAHVCSNWGWYMLLIELPFYMTDVLKFDIKHNAVLSSIPYLFMWLFGMIISKILDTMRSKKKISTTVARKIATLFASVVPGVVLSIVGFVETRWLAVLMMNIAVTCKGAMFCAFLSNHIDIAPNFAGTLVALTNTVATIPGIIVPVAIGKLTQDNPGVGSWRIAFYITVGLYIIEIITYMFLGSGKEQSWNKIEDSQEDQPLNRK